ncbi:MAG: hypothetical protein JNM28_02905 [Armatimonadetes bacterium]|nr:hypothetical protein [Armatimonadota bacterium]
MDTQYERDFDSNILPSLILLFLFAASGCQPNPNNWDGEYVVTESASGLAPVPGQASRSDYAISFNTKTKECIFFGDRLEITVATADQLVVRGTGLKLKLMEKIGGVSRGNKEGEYLVTFYRIHGRVFQISRDGKRLVEFKKK